MDNEFEYNKENAAESSEPEQSQPIYEDPNAGYTPQPTSQQYGYNENMAQQENYNYNTTHTSYETGLDEAPLSMGEWLLTILVMMLPCVGIFLYFYWAFSKTGNVNRRNYCRAYLIITGIMTVIAIIITVVFGVAAVGAIGEYYY